MEYFRFCGLRFSGYLALIAAMSGWMPMMFMTRVSDTAKTLNRHARVFLRCIPKPGSALQFPIYGATMPFLN
jgi:hypothetical protein